MWRSRLRFLALWLAGSLLLGLLQSLYFGYVPKALDVPGIANFDFTRIFLTQTIRYAVWPILLPLMAAFVRAYPLGRDLSESARTIAWYACTLPLWSAAHTALMVLCDYPAGLTMPGRTFYENWLNVIAGPLVQNTAVGALLLLVLATRDYQARLRAQERAEEELRTQAAQAKLAATLSLAQPAIFFPALQGIGALIPHDPDRAIEMVDRLGEFLRLSLQGTARAAVELREEADLVKRFLAVEEVRTGRAPAVEFDLPPAAREALLPGHVLLPLVAHLLRQRPDVQLEISAQTPEAGRAGELVLRCRPPFEFDPLPLDLAGLHLESSAAEGRIRLDLTTAATSFEDGEPESLPPTTATLAHA